MPESNLTTIPLTRGYYTTIDAEDFELVNQYKWHVHVTMDHRILYAVRSVWTPKQATMRMHRLIMGEPNCKVDHIDGNGLNNRRSNLRLTTNRQNTYNTPQVKPALKSGYRGVYWDKSVTLWKARIKVHGEFIYLGASKSLDKAIQLRQEGLRRHWGEYAQLPDNGK